VRVTRDALGVDENHIIDTLSIPLTATGDMSGKTRGVIVNG
jgi:hypothetical protein